MRRAWQRSYIARLTPVVAICLILCGSSLPGWAQDLDFESWLDGVRADAMAQGISSAIVETALSGLKPIPRVIELDRRQPEGRMSFAQYIERVVPPSREQAARARFREHQQLLRAVGARYGVQPRFIVALWGIESDFGRNTGGYPVIASLATLAHDGRRASFFRGELMNALKILDAGHVAPDAMVGSWAGAMGQNQFMPSSFHAYAVDHDGDGRRDIWQTLPDIFASIANYLSKNGWRDDQTWGRVIRLPESLDKALIDLDVVKPIGDWQGLGVRRNDGTALPTRQLQASLVAPDGRDGRTYMVYRNFKTILKWNRSTYFGLAVGRLSDSLRGQ